MSDFEKSILDVSMGRESDPKKLKKLEDKGINKPKKKQPMGGHRYKLETDSPKDIVSDINDLDAPNLGKRYKLKPGHGQSVSDFLKHVANNQPEALNVPELTNIIKRIFSKNNVILVDLSEQFENPLGILYSIKETSDGIKFCFTQQSLLINKSIIEACNHLKELGYAAVQQGMNILITAANPRRDTHDPDEVAKLVNADFASAKEYKKIPEYTIKKDKKIFLYKIENSNLVIECSKGLCNTTAIYQLSDINTRKIANVLNYQIDRYEQIFNPCSYGLSPLIKPFKHRKHALIGCGDACVIVITPNDESYLVTEAGEYPLCKPEGRISLDIKKSFKRIHHVNRLNFSMGEIYDTFSKLLRNRGYFIGFQNE